MKDRKSIKKSIITGNRGSTLITVIVAIAFVTILATIVLGTSLVNVRMKGIDKRIKDDFYYAEKALNDVYTGLGQDLAQIAGDDYETAFNMLAADDADVNQAELSDEEFRTTFLGHANDLVDVGDSDAIATFLDGYITSRSKHEKVESVKEVHYQDRNGDDCEEDDAGRIAIKGVQVSSTDNSGFRAVITTDIIINIPTVDFLGTNVDVSDYGIIANRGLYIEGPSGGEGDKTTITGNVYAGIHDSLETLTESEGVVYDDADYKEVTDDYSREKLFGGINIKDTKAIFNGNYIVSKGDVNLAGTNPKIRVSLESGNENPTNMWFTSLRTLSKKTNIDASNIVVPPIDDDDEDDKDRLSIDINANVFALNDLALNANNTSARFRGSYYGYNDATLADEGINIDVIGGKRDDSSSSAIVVNGSKVYLDMKDVNNFVLMGKAYIDFTSETDATDSEHIEAAKQIVPTAEGLALQTNQQLYLVPNDFIDGPNPAMGGDPDAGGKVEFEINDGLDDRWFGYKYLDTSIHKTYAVKQKDGVSWVYFDYLVFNDAVWMPNGSGGYMDTPDLSGKKLGTGGSISSKQKFFYDIMTATYDPVKEGSETQPTAYRLKERIDRSITNSAFFDLKGIVVGKGTDEVVLADPAHYYAKNAVINYERTSPTSVKSTVRGNTDGMYRFADYPQNLFRRYKWLCTKLDGKEDIPMYLEGKTVATTVDDIPNSDDTSNEWNTPSFNAPLCHFVRLDKVHLNDDIGDMYPDAARSSGLIKEAYGSCIAITPPSPGGGAPGTLDLSTLGDDYLVSGNYKGVIIVDGNIIVPQNMNITGLLMATGTVTLLGNNTITYDKGIIQSRIEKEINLIKSDDSDDALEDIDKAYKPYYLINYLSTEEGDAWLYNVAPGTKVAGDRVNTDYNDFIHYENWRKGEQ